MSINFEHKIEKDLESMDNRLSELEDKMTSIDSKLTQVVEAILGNSLTKEGGFFSDLKLLKEKIIKLEDKIEKQEDFKKKFTWSVGVLTIIVFLLQYLVDIYLKIK